MLTDLLETLQLCKDHLPEGTHPIHLARINVCAKILTWAVKAQPEHWKRVLDHAEYLVDLELAEKRGRE